MEERGDLSAINLQIILKKWSWNKERMLPTPWA